MTGCPTAKIVVVFHPPFNSSATISKQLAYTKIRPRQATPCLSEALQVQINRPIPRVPCHPLIKSSINFIHDRVNDLAFEQYDLPSTDTVPDVTGPKTSYFSMLLKLPDN